MYFPNVLIRSFLALFLLISLPLASTAAAEVTTNNTPNERLVFGIAPFMSPLALVKRMAPLRDYLSQEMGVEVVIETTNDATEFGKRSLSGKYDFVLTNPTFSLMALDQGGFQIVASQKKKLTGHFVVLEDSKINHIDDLKGLQVGCPPKVGFMGQLISPYLKSNFFSEKEMPRITYFHSHKDAISALRLKNIDATLIVNFMEKHLIAKNIPIRTIHKTDKYPGMTIIASNTLSSELFNRLKDSLFKIDQTDSGRQILKQISMSGYESLDKNELEKIRPYLPVKDF